ncbi:MAG TPA: hypothetical protein VL283_00110 [Candidatus Baltobacteraceae bacterium]|nr:hypothetical protein [Candidatus Baltobacteraceae bacterium]
MVYDMFNRKLKTPDILLLSALFFGLAVVMWLFARTYVPGMESPLSSLRRLRNVVVVQDQAVGSNVVISYAAVSQPSYVVIQAEGPGGDRILAVSRLLPEGEAHNFRVAIEGGLPDGFYYAVLRRDDGDGAFDPAKDGVARDAHGAAAITRFLVSGAPSG